LYRNYRGLNQGKKRAEIRPDQYQNGDKQKEVKIKQDVKLYITKSYVIEVFLYNSMFNPMTGMSFSATSKQA